MSRVQSHLHTLTPEQVEDVHLDSLKILETTGIRVDSERARAVFATALGQSIVDDIVRIPREVVEQAIESGPASVEIFDRAGESAFQLGGDQAQGTVYGIGVTNSAYQDPLTDEVVPFQRAHIELATRLGDRLEQFDAISTPGVIQDGEQGGEVIATLEMLANTLKPLVVLISDPQAFDLSLAMIESIDGDLSNKPFLIPYVNPITPLVMNEDTSDKMFSTIDHGLPLIYSSYGMSGATTPITAASTLALLNAELLAGLVFTQLVKAGTPVILGCLPSVFEMQNMFSAYTSQTMLVNLACADMMSHYKLPHAGTSGSGTGWGPDLLASGTLWMNHLTSSLGQVGFSPFVGGNFDSQAFSPTTIVYANEIIRQVRQFSAGFEYDKLNVGLEEIHKVGPGGNFLMSELTMAHYRKIHEQHSEVWPGYTLDAWRSAGSPAAIEILKKKTQATIETLQVPADHDEVLAKGKQFLNDSNARSKDKS